MSKILTTGYQVSDNGLLSRQLCMKDNSNIFFGVFDILSTVKYVNVKNINSYLVSYDIFKAFNRTNVSFV